MARSFEIRINESVQLGRKLGEASLMEKDMARGWESKAVEAQIEEGEHRISDESVARASMEVRARQLRLESLRLSRARILQQLERAKHPAHREVLAKGLEALEHEIEAVSAESTPAG